MYKVNFPHYNIITYYREGTAYLPHGSTLGGSALWSLGTVTSTQPPLKIMLPVSNLLQVVLNIQGALYNPCIINMRTVFSTKWEFYSSHTTARHPVRNCTRCGVELVVPMYTPTLSLVSYWYKPMLPPFTYNNNTETRFLQVIYFYYINWRYRRFKVTDIFNIYEPTNETIRILGKVVLERIKYDLISF